MGEYKWAALGETYRLHDFDEPTKLQMIEAMAILKKHNLNVVTT
jgi:hypothetical protein